MENKNRRISRLYAIHIVRFIIRLIMFFTAAALYITARINSNGDMFTDNIFARIFWWAVWGMLLIEMYFRFFPSPVSNIGCQKQLAKNYAPTGKTKPILTPRYRTVILAVLWILGNLIFGILYFADIIDAGMLILLSFAYGVGDLVCLLFFCPFRSWFLGNRCCSDCRIYNWDYALMFTPFIFIPSFYTYSLLAVSVVLLVIWEVSLALHPERFSEETNASLSCKMCKDKPCRHRKRLARKNRKK